MVKKIRKKKGSLKKEHLDQISGGMARPIIPEFLNASTEVPMENRLQFFGKGIKEY